MEAESKFKSHLEKLAESVIAYIMDFLNDKDMMNLSVACKTMNLKTRAYRQLKIKKEDLLNCMLAVLEFEYVSSFVFESTDNIDILIRRLKNIAPINIPEILYTEKYQCNDLVSTFIVHALTNHKVKFNIINFVNNCADYKTDSKFNFFVYNVRVMTIRDFCEFFITPKDSKKYSCLIKDVCNNYKLHMLSNKDILKTSIANNIDYISKLISIGCNKECYKIWRERAAGMKQNEKYKYTTEEMIQEISQKIKDFSEGCKPVQERRYSQSDKKLNNQK